MCVLQFCAKVGIYLAVSEIVFLKKIKNRSLFAVFRGFHINITTIVGKINKIVSNYSLRLREIVYPIGRELLSRSLRHKGSIPIRS